MAKGGGLLLIGVGVAALAALAMGSSNTVAASSTPVVTPKTGAPAPGTAWQQQQAQVAAQAQQAWVAWTAQHQGNNQPFIQSFYSNLISAGASPSQASAVSVDPNLQQQYLAAGATPIAAFMVLISQNAAQVAGLPYV